MGQSGISGEAPCCHHGYNISNVTQRKLDIVLGALETNRLCPFFSPSSSMSLYVTIWCNRIVLYLLGHMAMALSLLRAKEGTHEWKRAQARAERASAY